jgi:predicted PurR-regulated permease PerM
MLHPSTSTAPSRITPLVTPIVVLAALYLARSILIPCTLAGLFAFLLTPLVRGLEIWRLGRIPSVALVLPLTFAAVGGLAWIATNQLIDVLEEMPSFL